MLQYIKYVLYYYLCMINNYYKEISMKKLNKLMNQANEELDKIMPGLKAFLVG